MTRRQRVWAYAGVVAATLAAWQLTKLSSWLGARSLAKLTPAPFATIDEPAPGSLVAPAVTLEGRVAHETIRAPLWLMSSEGGREWKPHGEIATGADVWRKMITLGGRRGMHYRLAVVAAEMPLHNQFQEQLRNPPEPLWMRDREMRWAAHAAWRAADLGDGQHYPALPAGAHPVTAVDVVIGMGTPEERELESGVIFLPVRRGGR